MTSNTSVNIGANRLNYSDAFNASIETRALFVWASKPIAIVITVAHILGILGNLAAIVYLRTGQRRVRNKKHVLLLTALATNDLIALVGSLSATLWEEYFSGAKGSKTLCGLRVVLRIFGLGSGCIAITMALERYLALTKPFFYRKNVTYRAVWRALIVSWLVPAMVTCIPISGLSAYYSEEKGCLRLYKADTTPEFAYAVTNLVFSILICVVLVYFNMAVIHELCTLSSVKSGRHHERNSGINRQAHQHHTATPEEVTFSRSMATLSAVFVITWLPLLLTSALFMGLGSAYWEYLTPMRMGADVLLLLHYVLNPILYVVMWRRRPLASLWQSAVKCFQSRRTHPSASPAAAQHHRDISSAGTRLVDNAEI